MGTAVAELEVAREAVAQQHRSAVEELTDVFVDGWQSLYRIAMRKLENGADAEDAVQDAFLSAYTHLDQFKRQARMSTWVTTILINSARMKLRRRPRQVHVTFRRSILGSRQRAGRRNTSRLSAEPGRGVSKERACRAGG